jgi:hypothetical protein
LSGERCPYAKHQPRTLEGCEVWDLVMRCSGQLRLAANGTVLGLDLGACLSLAEASGLDTHAIALLLPACEAGLLQGFRNLAAEP